MSCTRRRHRCCDALHGWADGASGAGQSWRFGEPTSLRKRAQPRLQQSWCQNDNELPRAPVVKGLLVRRQHFRFVHPAALFGILRSLPGLESVTVEPWCRIHHSFDTGYQPRLDEYLQGAHTLKSLSIFEDHNLFFHGHSKRDLHPFLGTTLADESRSFEHLSVAFLADS
ncbi:hypothetical protein QBC33DRAFT_537620 [Phialemonium atrogriseum]|uniref:DUF6546 domain-containing protein n=1 Tax=Phialemonium atrogriseum TaxID=1093897 RepID=A0AAJ0C558_9PEZI|nr:uncharacterized protein QBC33DRAFT_537620 [Phialemonium atrogriseum]KAK1767871.1 hypothetical protein QBC33DRAFT_537620 [Phialemonium atrogriseum]